MAPQDERLTGSPSYNEPLLIPLPTPASVDRFRADLTRLHALDADDRLGLAVSGGPDSLALLLLAHAALPGRIEAATVDHGLRAASAVEAAMVADICAQLNVPHVTLKADWDRAAKEGVQAAARAYRYRALQAWCADRKMTWLATAHHVDDQAETLLMRLARGAGVGGLGAIRPMRQLGDVLLVRPLLGFTKVELVAIVAAAGLVPIDDPSNADERFDRTRARRLLAATDWLAADRLAAAASHLAEADAALAWAARAEYDRRVRSDAHGIHLDPAALPAELLYRLVANILAAVAETGEPPRGPELSRFIARLQAGDSATLGRVLARPGAVWRFNLAPPRRPRTTRPRKT